MLMHRITLYIVLARRVNPCFWWRQICLGLARYLRLLFAFVRETKRFCIAAVACIRVAQLPCEKVYTKNGNDRLQLPIETALVDCVLLMLHTQPLNHARKAIVEYTDIGKDEDSSRRPHGAISTV